MAPTHPDQLVDLFNAVLGRTTDGIQAMHVGYYTDAGFHEQPRNADDGCPLMPSGANYADASSCDSCFYTIDLALLFELMRYLFELRRYTEHVHACMLGVLPMNIESPANAIRITSTVIGSTPNVDWEYSRWAGVGLG